MPAKKQTATRQAVSSPATILQERTEILNILLDDAGKDWKPRNKSTSHTTHSHSSSLDTSQHRPTSAKQRPVTAKPSTPTGAKNASKAPTKATTNTTVATKVTTNAKVTNKTTPPKTTSKPMTPEQLREQQQILSILLDDAGKDWKPRNKGTLACDDQCSTSRLQVRVRSLSPPRVPNVP
jgi:hypothetical protein